MQLITKEHYELMDMFEKTFAREGRMDKEPKELWAKGFIYQHGEVNRLFKAFRQGVSYGRATA